MSRELPREAPGDVAAPPLAPATAIEKLTGWLRGLRFRQVLSIPVWLAAFGLLLVGDVLPQVMPLRAFREASRAGNLAHLVGVLLMVLAARLGASTASQLRALQPGRRPVLYAWRLPDRRARYAPLAFAPLAFAPLLLVAPVNEVIGFFSMIFAVITYLAWPVLAPAAVRRHIVLGGPVFGFGAAALVVIAAMAVSIALPRGIPQRMGSLEAGALLDVDELRAALSPSLATVGANPRNVSSRKRSSLDGTFELSYQYDAPDLSFSSSLTMLDPLVSEFFGEVAGDFPGFDATRAGAAAHDGWRIDGYDLSIKGQPSGVGLSAQSGARRYSLVISGLAMPLDEVVALMRPRLDSAALVSGLFPRLVY